MARRHAVLAVVLCVFAGSAFAALQLPSNITAEATGPHGAVVTYFAGADGSGDDENGRPIDKAACAPASGATFPLGATTVSCTGSNGGSGSFTVNVVDTHGPALHLPRDFTVPGSTNQGATVTYAASADDVVDGSVAVACAPASGTFFAVGTTTVHCSSTDSRQNASQGSFAVTVTAQQQPPPPPLNDITAEATGPNGAVVTFNTGGGPGDQDDENGRPMGTCAPASGSTFPLGETSVTCSNGTFKVKVVDTTTPALFLPPDITTQSAAVTYTASATDLVDGSVGVTCTPPSGSAFAAGTTIVHCSATDAHANSAAGTFNVTVQTPADTEAPTITSLTATPDVITPPNGKLVTVQITAGVHDNLDAAPYVGVYDVTANEAITRDDWNIVSPLTVELRADRDPHSTGRVYTIHVEAIDASGNRSVSSVTVTVPHDQSSTEPATAQPAKKWKSIRDKG